MIVRELFHILWLTTHRTVITCWTNSRLKVGHAMEDKCRLCMAYMIMPFQSYPWIAERLTTHAWLLASLDPSRCENWRFFWSIVMTDGCAGI